MRADAAISDAPEGTTPQRVVRALLFVGFAFAVMADPVSSVAYTIEASLRALNGHLGLLMATQIIVLAIIALVDVNYWQLVGRFPLGGGSAEAAARAFGTGWVFLPIGALIVDFVLTITISVAAAVSALIAYVPVIAPARIAIGLALLTGVAALDVVWSRRTTCVRGDDAAVRRQRRRDARSWFREPRDGSWQRADDRPRGLRGAGRGAVVSGCDGACHWHRGTVPRRSDSWDSWERTTGDGSRAATIFLTMVIVAALTIAITALAVRLHVGIPSGDSTQIADVAHAAAGGGAIYALFQASSALLLLAAASSSFQAGPGLLKALSRHPSSAGVGILPRGLGETNRHHTPYWSVLVYLAISAAILLAAGGHEQELVLFYAVAVFVSFLAGLAAMARFSLRDGRRGLFAINLVGAVAVAFTLIVNLGRGYPLLSLGATVLIAGVLYVLWTRAGRPSGVEEVEAHIEDD